MRQRGAMAGDAICGWTPLRLRGDIRGIQHDGNYECDDPNGKALLQRISQQVGASQPWKLLVAEDLQSWDQITAPVASGGFGFSAQWNESLCYVLRGAVIPPQR